jgi:predicted adenylyl cyclase CyaB
MPRNIEIKARLEQPEAVLERARALADGPAELLEQDDSFFAAPHGRLKLRAHAGGPAELIHYERPDAEQARASDYVRVPVPDPDTLRVALTRALGAAGRVRKRRWLLRVGATRIHLDRVEGLGDFIELEVVLREGQPDAEGAAVAEALMQALGLAQAPRLARAYVDLLNAMPAAHAPDVSCALFTPTAGASARTAAAPATD